MEPIGFPDELNVGFEEETKDHCKDDYKVPWNAIRCLKEEKESAEKTDKDSPVM